LCKDLPGWAMIVEDNACVGAKDQYPQGSSGAALLFSREGLSSVDSFDPGQTDRPERRGRRIAGPAQPRQFSLDSARNWLAQHAAEVDRPKSVRHHLGRYRLQAISLAEHRFGIV